MKRKFLAKAITLGLMLAVPLGAQAADYTPTNKTETEDGKYNLTYEYDNGAISKIAQLGITNDGEKSKYEDKEINDLTIKRTNAKNGMLAAYDNSSFKLNINGRLEVESIAAVPDDTWAPLIHVDNNVEDRNAGMSISAANITLKNNATNSINLVAKADGIRTNVDLNAAESI